MGVGCCFGCVLHGRLVADVVVRRGCGWLGGLCSCFMGNGWLHGFGFWGMKKGANPLI